MKTAILLAEVALRPVAKEDVDCFHTLLADADVRRYLCDDDIFPRGMVIDRIAQSIALDSLSLGIWLIRQRRGGKSRRLSSATRRNIIGYAGLLPLSPPLADHAEAAELSIALHRSAWGQGIGRAAVEALAVHAREICRVKRLVASADAPNERSHRLILRSGFHRTGETAGPKHLLVLYERMLGDC